MILADVVQHKRWRIVVCVVFATITTFLFCASYFLVTQFSEFFSPFMIEFVLNDPTYLLDYTKTFFAHASVVFVLLVLWAINFTLLYFSAALNFKIFRYTFFENRLTKIAALVLIPITIFFINQELKLHRSNHFLTIESSFFLSLQQHATSDYLVKKLEFSINRKVPECNSSKTEQYNVLFVVNESWDITGVPSYDSVSSMPYLAKWLKEEAGNTVVFKNAFTNSTCTDVSMPSIFTGTSPAENCNLFFTNPFIWDYAKSANYFVGYFSSQRIAWNGYDEFIGKSKFDVTFSADKEVYPIVNDMGFDDLKLSNEFNKFIKSYDRSRPFFVVYNTNALHGPCQKESEGVQVPEELGNYQKAQLILDKSLELVIQNLKQKGLDENTIIVMTGDHGNDDPSSNLPRIKSFYENSFRIPIIIKLPKKFDKRRRQSLSLNSLKNVSNLDLVPTIKDIICPDNQQEYKGRSLFDYIAEDRFIEATNVNDLKRIDGEACFGLVYKNYRLVCSIGEGCGMYDMSKYKSQVEGNRIKDQSVLTVFEKYIQSNNLLKSHYKKCKSVF
jgi:arylsulfatase A-like enzyme